MGTCHTASVSLGFVLSECQLLALLKVLRQQASPNADTTASNASDDENSASDAENDEKLETTVTKKAKLDDEGESKATARSSGTEKNTRKEVKLDEETTKEVAELIEYAAGDLYTYFQFTMGTSRWGCETEMAVSFLGVYGGDSQGYSAESSGKHWQDSK
jgi:hypothetical protein